MSKINCAIAGDLIPLYVDEVLSQSSAELVEEHLMECESCTEKVNSLKNDVVIKNYDERKPLNKFKNRILRHKVIIGILVAGLIWFAIHYIINSVEFIYSYDDVKDNLKVETVSDYPVSGSDIAAFYYDGNKKVFDTNVTWQVVGINDGVLQVEATIYMSRYGYDYTYELYSNIMRSGILPQPVYDYLNSYYNPVFPYYPEKPDLVYDTDTFNYYDYEPSEDSSDYLDENYNLHITRFYMPSVDADDIDYEIVRVYYGKWNYTWVDTFHRVLLWEK